MKGIVLAMIAALLMLEHRGNPMSLIVLLIPLCFIWYSEAIGAFTGPLCRGGFVDKETPAWLISAVGYVWLLGLILVELRMAQ